MSSEIQFEKAQFASGDHCVVCQSTLEGSYFRLNGNTLCHSCAEKARFDNQLHQSQPGGMARAILFGLGAAAAGAALYGTIALLTGFEFALIAILIGWMVGKAMMRGSRGKGGRRFQVAAVLITYLSITGGYVPSIIRGLAQMDSTATAAEPAKAGQPGPGSPEITAAGPRDEPLTAGSFFVALAFLLGVAAMAPLINLTSGISGILGLVIIGLGLMKAWKETHEQPFVVSGPFPVQPRQTEVNEAPA